MAKLSKTIVEEEIYFEVGGNEAEIENPENGFVSMNNQTGNLEIYRDDDWIEFGVVKEGLEIYTDPMKKGGVVGNLLKNLARSDGKYDFKLINSPEVITDLPGYVFYDNNAEKITTDSDASKMQYAILNESNPNVIPELGDLYADSTESFSVDVWFSWVKNPNMKPGVVNYKSHAVIGRAFGFATAGHFLIGCSISSLTAPVNTCELRLRGNDVYLSEGNPVNDEKWHNAIISYSKFNNRVTGYFDGEFVGESSGGGAAYQDYPLMIANAKDDSDISGAFEGRISTAKFYSRVLSQGEALRNYNAMKKRYGH